MALASKTDFTRTSFVFPCPLCKTPLRIRLSKKDRPYLVCDDCGLQMFVRGDRGEKRLKQLAQEG